MVGLFFCLRMLCECCRHLYDARKNPGKGLTTSPVSTASITPPPKKDLASPDSTEKLELPLSSKRQILEALNQQQLRLSQLLYKKQQQQQQQQQQGDAKPAGVPGHLAYGSARCVDTCLLFWKCVRTVCDMCFEVTG